jgi:hypothetical protein
MERTIQVVELWSRAEVQFTGPVSFKDRLEAVDVICPLLVERRLTRVLIDYSHAWVDEPSAESFAELDARLRRESHLKQCWIAIVNPPDFHAIPTEDIGHEIGFPVRRFYNRHTALEWLNSQLV